MGRSGDFATPAKAVDRSLFKKQSAKEAHGSDFGLPDDERSPGRRPAAAADGAPPRSGDSVSEKGSLFRKNDLDEMTVSRTEKPVPGVKPVKRAQIGIGSYEDPADKRAQGRRSKKSGRPGH